MPNQVASKRSSNCSATKASKPQSELTQGSIAEGPRATISTSSSVRMEEIRQGAPGARLWFQVYLYKDSELVRSLIDRARAIECDSLVITVDVPLLGRRLRDRRNRFTVPLRPSCSNITTHPRG